jgi:hypothetical protein
LTGHERRLVGRDEQRPVCHLDRFAEAAHRDVQEAALGVVVEERLEQRRQHGTRAHHHVLRHAEYEWESFNRAVTDWERQRYFEGI